MAKPKDSTGWKGTGGAGKPTTGTGPPGKLPGGKLSTNYQHSKQGPSDAKAGGALPKSIPTGGRSTNYIRGTDKGKGARGGDDHNASAGRIRDVGAP
jgi:hypothetical protein